MNATARKAAAAATLSLPFRMPPQEWFTLRQAGAVLGLSESMVEKLYDGGALTGHHHNAGQGQRLHKRIPRASLIAYAVATADYADESLADAYVAALTHLPAETLLRIANAARQLIAANDRTVTTGQKIPA